MRRNTGLKNFKIIANQVKDEEEALSIFSKIVTVADRFLDVYLDIAGFIPADANIGFATKKQKLWAEYFPETSGTKALTRICDRLIG